MERLREGTARECGLVGCADLAPELDGIREELLRAGGIALGEPQPAVGDGRARDQRFALETDSDRLELGGSRARLVEVTGRDLDLDLRVEQRRPAQVGIRRPLFRRDLQRVFERVANRR